MVHLMLVEEKCALYLSCAEKDHLKSLDAEEPWWEDDYDVTDDYGAWWELDYDDDWRRWQDETWAAHSWRDDDVTELRAQVGFATSAARSNAVWS